MFLKDFYKIQGKKSTFKICVNEFILFISLVDFLII